MEQPFANVGQVYNVYSKGESDLYTFNFSTGLTLYQQFWKRKTYRAVWCYLWTVRWQGLCIKTLWIVERCRSLVNNPLSLAEVDKSAFKEINQNGDSIFYPVYEKDTESKFFFKIREQLKVNERDFVNVHSLSPDQLSLDLFSARELADLNIVDYRGYDYLGNKTTGNISFEDFFTAKDADGRRSFPVAPFSYLCSGVTSRINFL